MKTPDLGRLKYIELYTRRKRKEPVSALMRKCLYRNIFIHLTALSEKCQPNYVDWSIPRLISASIVYNRRTKLAAVIALTSDKHMKILAKVYSRDMRGRARQRQKLLARIRESVHKHSGEVKRIRVASTFVYWRIPPQTDISGIHLTCRDTQYPKVQKTTRWATATHRPRTIRVSTRRSRPQN